MEYIERIVAVIVAVIEWLFAPPRLRWTLLALVIVFAPWAFKSFAHKAIHDAAAPAAEQIVVDGGDLAGRVLTQLMPVLQPFLVLGIMFFTLRVVWRGRRR